MFPTHDLSHKPALVPFLRNIFRQHLILPLVGNTVHYAVRLPTGGFTPLLPPACENLELRDYVLFIIDIPGPGTMSITGSTQTLGEGLILK